MTDRKKTYIISLSILAALLLVLFAPDGSGRILAALLLLPAAAIVWINLKKRPIGSLYSKQVLMIISVIGLLYLMLILLSGLKFGFYRTGYGFKGDIILRLSLPIAVIIFSTEIIRYVLIAQQVKGVPVITYFICLIADVLTQYSISEISTFSHFMDVVGIVLFPGIVANFLYNYMSQRYGFLPNMVFRALTVLSFYFIPYNSAISNSLVAFINLLLPVAIYFFIDSLYEKKKKYALGGKTRFSRVTSTVISLLVVAVMLITVMLISNQFKYGVYVVATESMTGEINKGDAVIYEKYDDQIIKVGQIIAFEDGRSVLIHRVVKIEIINGEYRFYTKGDANEDIDSGYVVKSEIVGLVDHKIPYIGYSTIWVRSLFKR